MRRFALAAAICVTASSAMSQEPTPPIRELPPEIEAVAWCSGGGGAVAAVASGTGIGTLPALVLWAMCIITYDEWNFRTGGRDKYE